VESSTSGASLLFRWERVVLSDKGPKSPTMRHVLRTLSFHMDQHGRKCFPSIATLVRETGLSNRTVIDHLEQAVTDGWIIRAMRGGGRGWKRYEYEISFQFQASEEGSPRQNGEAVKEIHHESSGVVKEVHNVMGRGGEADNIEVVKELHTNSQEELLLDKRVSKQVSHLPSVGGRAGHMSFYEIKALYEKAYSVNAASSMHFSIFKEWSATKPRGLIEGAFQKAADRNVNDFNYVKKIVAEGLYLDPTSPGYDAAEDPRYSRLR